MRAFVFIVLTGCGVSVNTTRLAPWPASMVPHHAELVTCEPARAYTAVALLHATNWPWAQRPSLMVATLRERADAMGCDAIQLTEFDPAPKGHAVIDAYCLVYAR